ncbi:FMN reductase [Stenotrophomonas indicatrix]|uniref:FMN reductase n=1 Tax=Stenotrophomonas indicatrix TaxID=2045451 RepID=A0ABT8QBF4_9GAMM|nr:FMN reductase [Stenotrophomonas indicatrix]PJL12622.1 FMN reductase [Stenotrophomonas maltophilia]MDN8661512.1 FMN reductase [Stenotrophomonas indicatrix]MDN8669236.1 FMN reductase [Stenotrophomonas indicatrix]PII15587.1 FMN reductase [Stenotrophomonas indicatrix]PJL21648.1 FMN reductase [Stenotrophomonas maltophilia]
MSSALNVVALIGSPTASANSRTLLLVRHLLEELRERINISVELVELAPIARSLGQALQRSEVEPQVERALATIESAQLLVAAAPVYRGSYPGLFKHLIDFIGLDALVDTPVLLAATGGSERHALVIDHQLRPLFAFLQAHTLPIGVYATPADFDGDRINSAALQARIQLAAERAAGHVAHLAAVLPAPLRRIA